MSATCPTCGTAIRPDAPSGQCSRCLLHLAFPGAAPGADTASLEGESLLSPAQVRHFGDYELLEEIARGGMGVVYRARQKSLNRPVAVKMILAGELASPASVQRFSLEAKAAARLDHPHIVPIYEVGERDEQHYFAMKLVEGGSLAERVSDFRFEVSDSRGVVRERQRAIAALLAKVADALAYAHAHGILHRDVKPSNILLDRGDEPLLTDFGLAKLTSGSSGPTRSTSVLGSPSYMAPEQAAGKTSEVTTAADVYGLGAVLYELLTGRPPFSGETAIATLRMVLDEDAEPVQRLAPGAHSDLATICHRCLMKEPGARYRSASALADELRRFLRGEPIVARPISAGERFWRWCKRRPAIAGLGAAAIVATFIGVSGVLWQWRRAESANAGLVSSLRRAEWRHIEQLIDANEAPRAVALLAARLRENPDDRGAAMLAMSVLEQRWFGLPASLAVSHGPGVTLHRVQLHDNGTDVVTAGSDGQARLWAIERLSGLLKGETNTGGVRLQRSRYYEFVTNRPPLLHGGPVRWVEFSQDSSRDWVVTASDDGTARVWRVADGHPVSPPLRHDGPVKMAVFAPGARRVASASVDGTVRLWDAESGAAVGEPLRHDGPVEAVAFSRDGRWLASGARGGTMLWNAERPDLGAKFHLPDDRAITSLQFDPSGARLLTVSEGRGGVKVWDVSGGRLIFECKGGKGTPVSGEFSPDGSRIGGHADDRLAWLWEGATGRPAGPALPHYYNVIGARFTPDGSRLATCSWDSTVRFWDAVTGLPAGEPLLHTEPVVEMDFKKSGMRMVTLSGTWKPEGRFGTTQMRMWSLRQRKVEPLRFSPGRSAVAVAFSPDGRKLAVSTRNAQTWVLDATSMKPLVGPLTNGTAYVRGLAWTPDSGRLVAASLDGSARVWNAASGQIVAGPVQVLPRTLTSALGGNGEHLLLGGDGSHVALWNIRSGEVRHFPGQQTGEINGTDISPDGKLAATAASDGTVGVWDVATGVQRLFFRGHADEVMSIRFSPEGRTLLTCSHDETACLWDLKTGARIGEVMRHQAQVGAARFSPDGRLIVTAARDGTARLWDGRTGRPRTEPMRHRSALRGVCFSPDGRRVVTEDHIGLRVWDALSGDPLTLTLPHSTSPGIGYDAQGMQVTFSPDGRRVAHGTASEDAVIYEVPAPDAPAPDWFPELLEAVSGNRVLSGGVLDQVQPVTMMNMRRRLGLGVPVDFYSRWTSWYLEGLPSARGISAWVETPVEKREE